jgi:hypothetical protein
MNKANRSSGVIRSLDGTRTITVEEFDRIFDDGSDEIDQFVDWSKSIPADAYTKRVNVDMPVWMILRLDREATHRGVSRQALIKMWLAERLEPPK